MKVAGFKKRLGMGYISIRALLSIPSFPLVGGKYITTALHISIVLQANYGCVCVAFNCVDRWMCEMTTEGGP